MKAPIAIDLFGGIGGVAIGMLKAGFRVFSIDSNPLWAAVIALNLAGRRIACKTADLLLATPKQLLSDLEVRPAAVGWLHGSPECQDHSYAGERRRDGDGHNQLLAMSDWAAACPQAHVTIENVRGVQDSECYQRMFKALSKIREVREYVVNATWYGLPQQRRRVWLCAGPCHGRCIPVPPPTCDIFTPRTWLWSMKNPCPIGRVDDGWGEGPTPWQFEILPFVPEGGTPEDITDPAMRKWLIQMYPDPAQRKFIRRLHRDRPVPTVLTGVKIRRMLLHCHPWLNRPSTLRECARFQGFPDEFKFPKELLSLTDAHRAVGNAVPPPMAAAFARHFRAELKTL